MIDLTDSEAKMILTEAFCANMVQKMGVSSVSDKLIGSSVPYTAYEGQDLRLQDMNNPVKDGTLYIICKGDSGLATFSDLLAVLNTLPGLGKEECVLFLGSPCYLVDTEGYHGSDRKKYGFILRPDREGGREVGLVNMQDITLGQLPRDVSVARRVLDALSDLTFNFDPSETSVAF